MPPKASFTTGTPITNAGVANTPAAMASPTKPKKTAKRRQSSLMTTDATKEHDTVNGGGVLVRPTAATRMIKAQAEKKKEVEAKKEKEDELMKRMAAMNRSRRLPASLPPSNRASFHPNKVLENRTPLVDVEALATRGTVAEEDHREGISAPILGIDSTQVPISPRILIAAWSDMKDKATSQKAASGEKANGSDIKSAESSGQRSDVPKEGQKLFITDLKPKIRGKIWELVVVKESTLVWPDMSLDHEQPDLAMTSRLIRKEVLELYYSRNVFAIDVSAASESVGEIEEAQPKGSRKRKHKVVGPSPIERWATVMEEGCWLGKMQRWCFSYLPSQLLVPLTPQEEDDQMITVSLIVREISSEVRARAEVHHDARCIRGGSKRVAQASPSRLDQSVTRMVEAANGGDLRAGPLVELGKAIRSQGSELWVNTCVQRIQEMSEEEVGQEVKRMDR